MTMRVATLCRTHHVYHRLAKGCASIRGLSAIRCSGPIALTPMATSSTSDGRGRDQCRHFSGALTRRACVLRIDARRRSSKVAACTAQQGGPRSGHPGARPIERQRRGLQHAPIAQLAGDGIDTNARGPAMRGQRCRTRWRRAACRRRGASPARRPPLRNADVHRALIDGDQARDRDANPEPCTPAAVPGSRELISATAKLEPQQGHQLRQDRRGGSSSRPAGCSGRPTSRARRRRAGLPSSQARLADDAGPATPRPASAPRRRAGCATPAAGSASRGVTPRHAARRTAPRARRCRRHSWPATCSADGQQRRKNGAG